MMKFREDQYYIGEVLKGDVNAFEPLVKKHQDLVFSIVRRIVKTPEDAEEVAQDVFLKAYHKLGKFKGESKFSTWLYRIAYNTAVSHGRKKKTEFIPAGEDQLERIPDTDIDREIMGLSAEEQGKLVRDALSVLPATENLIISLYYYHQKDIHEIGKIIGMTETNVKVKLHRIRKKMLKEMNHILGREKYSVA
jgi:RNA polymerase sigma-70 factor (ECF subfamily)